MIQTTAERLYAWLLERIEEEFTWDESRRTSVGPCPASTRRERLGWLRLMGSAWSCLHRRTAGRCS